MICFSFVTGSRALANHFDAHYSNTSNTRNVFIHLFKKIIRKLDVVVTREKVIMQNNKSISMAGHIHGCVGV